MKSKIREVIDTHPSAHIFFPLCLSEMDHFVNNDFAEKIECYSMARDCWTKNLHKIFVFIIVKKRTSVAVVVALLEKQKEEEAIKEQCHHCYLWQDEALIFWRLDYQW